MLVSTLVAALALAQADVKLVPFAAPSYTPELGFIFTGGGAMTWNGDPSHPDLPRSTLNALAGGTTVGAALLQARLVSYLDDDRWRIQATLDVRDMPDHYFGVGLRNGASRHIGHDTTSFRRTWWNFDPSLLRQLSGHLYGGVGVQLNGSAVREVSDGVAADLDFQRSGPLVVNTGVSLTLQYDTRDVPTNAWKGMLLAATWTGFGQALGANTAFHALTIDYRHFVQLFRRGSTLAWQVKYRTAFGEVPWSEMSLVGTPFDLRAYRWGQYRDRTGLVAILEYRFMLPFDPDSLWSRLGVVAWAGVGALGSTALPDFSSVLPCVGVGVRVELLKRVTVRLDVGFGRGSQALYVNFLEAF